MTTFEDHKSNPSYPYWKKLLLIVFATIGVLSYLLFDLYVKENDAGYFMVTQNRFTGFLDARMTPGKFFGPHLKTFKYRISGTLWFSADTHEGESGDRSVPVRYSDAGQANISGNVRWEMPSPEDIVITERGDTMSALIALHQQYRNQNNFLQKTMREQVTEAVNISAQLMTSTESYRSRKAEYMRIVLDQANNGVYILESFTEVDTLGEEVISMDKNRIKKDNDGELMRKTNPLKNFGVHLTLLKVDEPIYESDIKLQITSRRNALMDEVISASEGKLAVQQNLTEAAEGEARLVTTQYTQEVINIQEIVAAELVADTATISAGARRAVAMIQRQEKETRGKEALVTGNAQANVKRLYQSADSNLKIRLDAFVEGQRQRSIAFAEGKAPMPNVLLPAAQGGGSSSTDNMLNILGVNAALKLPGASATQ